MAEGPNVDIAPKYPYSWDELEDNRFDVVISGQAFEHSEFFWLTAAEMARVLKPGGKMCIIAPRGFERHRYPVDCYRFDADGMLAICRWCSLEPLHVSTDMTPDPDNGDWHIENCEDSFLIAQKPLSWPGLVDYRHYVFKPAPMGQLSGGFAVCPRLVQPPMLPQSEHEACVGALHAEIARRDESIRQRDAEISRLEKLVELYETSNSWRVTKPLRQSRAFLRKICGRLERK